MTISTFYTQDGLPHGRGLRALLIGACIAVATLGLFIGCVLTVSHIHRQVQDSAQSARKLDWHAAVVVTDMDPRVLTVLLLDRNGAPVNVDSVSGELHRPGLEAADEPLAVSFTPAGPSLWRAAAGHLPIGNWDLRIEAQRPDGPAYQAEWRLRLKSGA